MIRLSFSWLHKAKEVLILDFFFLELRDVLEIWEVGQHIKIIYQRWWQSIFFF